LVARGGDNRSPDKSPIEAPPLPLIDNPLAFGIMPTLVPLQDVTTAAILARRYPKQSNRSPFLTPQKTINATSLLDGYDMTPLDHLSPAAATLDQIRDAERTHRRRLQR